MRKHHINTIVAALLIALALITTVVPQAQAASYTTLRFGARGSAVLKLQKALVALGYDPNGTDGKYGTGTQNAVMQYQSANGLVADGKAGPLTLSKLYASAGSSSASTGSSGSTATSTNPNTLKYGDSGDRVRELQAALVKLGYNTNGVDGRFGAGTRSAVTRFQSAQRLTADGLAGTATLTLLYQLAGSATGEESNSSNMDSSTGTSSGSTSSTGSADGSYSRTLRKGMTGADVKVVQTQLQALGYYLSSLDGVYGTGSIAAVKAFQKRNGLTADGLAGYMTFSKLFSNVAIAANGTSSSGSSDSSGSTSDSSESTSDSSGSTSDDSGSSSAYVSLRYGATGASVKALQKALQALNYNVGVDGDYGALTQSAVAAFQKQNGLTADGVAGAKTQEVLFSGSAKEADPNAEDDMKLTDDTGKASGPSESKVKLLHWFNDIKPSVCAGQTVKVFDPATSLQWTLRFYSLGRHADSEPLTLTDTKIIYKAFGYTNTWTPKPVYVQLPSGTWTLATMHNVPHLTGSIKDNGFDGHLCVHFLRDMEECARNDPDYGVTNQNAIRKKWKQMTGEVVE